MGWEISIKRNPYAWLFACGDESIKDNAIAFINIIKTKVNQRPGGSTFFAQVGFFLKK